MLAFLLRKAQLSLAISGAFALCTFVTNAAPALAAGGQTGILSGNVVDAGHRALANADILITAPTGRYKAHTNAKGNFKILGADVDTYTVTVQKDGFARVVEPGVAVMGDQSIDLGTITMQQS